jgi:hypothetical protein
MPTTTPAAMPAVLGLLSSLAGAADALAVGVLTGTAEVAVAIDGFADEELTTGLNVSILFRVFPVRTTQIASGPPPAHC